MSAIVGRERDCLGNRAACKDHGYERGRGCLVIGLVGVFDHALHSLASRRNARADAAG